MAQESKDTRTAAKNEIEYVKKFQIRAAEILLGALAKVRSHSMLIWERFQVVVYNISMDLQYFVQVNTEIVKALQMSEMRSLFRSLRIPLMEKRSISMRNRVRIANWIRICKRSVHNCKPLLEALLEYLILSFDYAGWVFCMAASTFTARRGPCGLCSAAGSR